MQPSIPPRPRCYPVELSDRLRRLTISGRFRKLSWGLEKFLCDALGGFHFDGFGVDEKLRRAGSRGQKAKGLGIFDMRELQQKWDPQFHLFPELPVELRLSVWQFSLPTKRVIALRRKDAEEELSLGFKITLPQYFAANSTFPILHANREAREEALRSYKLSFDVYGTGMRTYFNSNLDTIYFGYKDEMTFAQMTRLLAQSFNHPISSIALSPAICHDLSTWLLRGPNQNADVVQEARALLNASCLKEAFCISGLDPDIPPGEFEISSCHCGSVGSLETEQIESLERFLGVNLTCGEIVTGIQ